MIRYLSAQFIITNSGPPLKRGIIAAGDDGTIISIEDTGGELKETRDIEFYNGIIIPGFVNCHCHLELSHMRGAIPGGTGLAGFLTQLQKTRNSDPATIESSAAEADRELYNEGVVLCADICNTPATFGIKKTSPVRYVNFLEVFATDPGKAESKMKAITKLAEDSERENLPFYIVPHTTYTVSMTLFRLLKEKTAENRVSSIHFMETRGEDTFISHHSGPLFEALKVACMLPEKLETPPDIVSAIMNEVTPAGSLILVHNTFTDRKTIQKINRRADTFWCLCPLSNIFIENMLPPADLLASENCDIVCGTDSLASNTKLSILSELKLLQENFPQLGLDELIRWATINGARALGENDKFGKIETGMRPGLLLLKDADLTAFRLLADTSVTRLI